MEGERCRVGGEGQPGDIQRQDPEGHGATVAEAAVELDTLTDDSSLSVPLLQPGADAGVTTVHEQIPAVPSSLLMEIVEAGKKLQLRKVLKVCRQLIIYCFSLF